MIVTVCDTGPLTHLWQIDLWSAFDNFDEIHLAHQVIQEIHEHMPLDQLAQLANCTVHQHEISQQKLKSYESLLPTGMKLEEADLSTLALAQQIAPDLILTDDLALRRAAEALGQKPMGSVGILLRAYKTGRINFVSLDQAIDKLFVHSTLYLHPNFKTYVRRLIADAVDHHDNK